MIPSRAILTKSLLRTAGGLEGRSHQKFSSTSSHADCQHGQKRCVLYYKNLVYSAGSPGDGEEVVFSGARSLLWDAIAGLDNLPPSRPKKKNHTRRNSCRSWKSWVGETDKSCLNSEVAYRLCSSDFYGLDRLLPNNDQAPCAPSAKHAQIRSRREEKGALPGGYQGWTCTLDYGSLSLLSPFYVYEPA